MRVLGFVPPPQPTASYV